MDNENNQQTSQGDNAADEAQQAAEVLQTLLHKMGYDFTVEAEQDAERVTLQIEGDDEGELVGNKGETLDALQYLVGRMTQRSGGHRALAVDDGGYRERRVEALRELARNLSEKVHESGNAVAVNPMSAHDRRVMHMELRDDPKVRTRSEGEGIYRRLVIEPSGR